MASRSRSTPRSMCWRSRRKQSRFVSHVTETLSKKEVKVRFLFTTTAGMGHFHPLVPLAQAAVHAGHEVAFACPQVLCAYVEASGFPAFATFDEGSVAAGRAALRQRLAQPPAGET